MSDRGSILISTANDIGEALVEKLGGEGYAPAVWDKEYNKLGIAEVDSAPALSVLENSSETGTARGSILMSTANAIGAMLNKKYNTDRGFKPKEWASAGRKMKALETDTKSGSIVNIQGAKETPLLSLVGTIDPTIEGTSEVEAYKLGKNLCANNLSTESVSGVDITIGTDGTITLDGKATARITRSLCTNFFLKKGTYVLSCGTPNLPASCYLNLNGGGLSKSCTVNTASISFTLTEDATIIYIRIDLANGSEFDNFKIYPMLEVGSSASTYEPYKAPTTYTADLGRTIHGGTADIINGTGTDNCTNRDLVGEGFTWIYNTTELSFPYFVIGANAPNKAANKNFVCEGYVNRGNYRSVLQDGEIGVFNNTTGINRFCIRDDSCTTLEQFLEKNANTKITYEVTNPVEFTFDGQEISTSGDVENYYTSAGDTSIEYYAVPTPYTRGTASGAIANVQSARTDLPFTKVKGNIAPNLTGVESVEVNKCGVNLFDKTAITPNTWIIVNSTDTEASNSYSTSDYIPVSAGKRYFVSFKDSNRSAYYDRNKNGIEYFSFNGNASFTALYDGYIRVTIKNDINLDTFIINEGNEEASYEQYSKTTYTADLGEPVYGGSVDLVSGEKVSSYKIITVGNSGWTYYESGSNSYLFKTFDDKVTPQIGDTSHELVCDNASLPYGGVNYASQFQDLHIYQAANKNIYIKDLSCSSESDYYEKYSTMKIGYELATPIESSIAGQVIVPSEGVNNLWNNAGGDTDVEYFTTE